MKKLILALAITAFIASRQVYAAPVINNSTPEAKAEPVAEVVQPTITSEAPTPTPVPVVETEQTTPVVSTPKEIAKATLIDLGHGDAWYAVEYIGFKESSWNPTAINSIGACGLFQALPCEKMPCSLSDVACQVRWATNYATTRYGSWHRAYTFWIANNWW
jgi:hypothetical protein